MDFQFLVTHRYPLDKWANALDSLRTPTGERGKVVLTLAGD